MKNHFLFAAIGTVSVLTFSACSPFKNAENSELSVAERFGALTDPNVQVCFGLAKDFRQYLNEPDSPVSEALSFTAQQKRWIQEVIEKEYSLQRTGVAFHGFKDCPERNDQNKRIMPIYRGKITNYSPVNQSFTIGQTEAIIIDDNLEKMVQAGQPTDEKTTVGVGSILENRPEDVSFDENEEVPVRKQGGLPKKYLGQIFKRVEFNFDPNAQLGVILSFEQMCDSTNNAKKHEVCVKLITLHEFGHVAGLRHEHPRPEALADKNCQTFRGSLGQDSVTGERLSSTTENFGIGYDQNSVMNYCYVSSVIESKSESLIPQAKLSEKDVATLKNLYRITP